VLEQQDFMRLALQQQRPAKYGTNRLGYLSEHDASLFANVRLKIVPAHAPRANAAVLGYTLVAVVTVPPASQFSLTPDAVGVVKPPKPKTLGGRDAKKGSSGGSSVEAPLELLAQPAYSNDEWASLNGREFIIGALRAYARASDAVSDFDFTVAADPQPASASNVAAEVSISMDGGLIPILAASGNDVVAPQATSEHAAAEKSCTFTPSGSVVPRRHVTLALSTAVQPFTANAESPQADAATDASLARAPTTELATRMLLAGDGMGMLRLALSCIGVTTVASHDTPTSPAETPHCLSPHDRVLGGHRRSSLTPRSPSLGGAAGGLGPAYASLGAVLPLPPRVAVRIFSPIVTPEPEQEELRHDRQRAPMVMSKWTLPLDTTADGAAITAVPVAAATTGEGALLAHPTLSFGVEPWQRHIPRSLCAPPLALPIGVVTPLLVNALSLALGGLIGSSEIVVSLRIELSIVAFPHPTRTDRSLTSVVRRPFVWSREPVHQPDPQDAPPTLGVIPASTVFAPPAPTMPLDDLAGAEPPMSHSMSVSQSSQQFRLTFGFAGLDRNTYAIRDGSLVFGGMHFIAAIAGPHNWSKNPAHALLPIPANPGPLSLSVSFGPQHKSARGKHVLDVWKALTLGLMPAERGKGSKFSNIIAAALASKRASVSSQNAGGGGVSPSRDGSITPRTEGGSAVQTPREAPLATISPAISRPPSAGLLPSALDHSVLANARRLSGTDSPGRSQTPRSMRMSHLAVRVVIEDGAPDPLVAFIPIVVDWSAVAK
jgi:hypothetical protein